MHPNWTTHGQHVIKVAHLCPTYRHLLAWRRHQRQRGLKTVIFHTLCVRHIVGLDLSREQPLGPSRVEACMVKSLESVCWNPRSEKNPGSEQKNKCLSFKIKVYPLKTVWTVLYFLNKGTLIFWSHSQSFQPVIHNNTLGEHCQRPGKCGNVWLKLCKKGVAALKEEDWNPRKKPFLRHVKLSTSWSFIIIILAIFFIP